MLVGRGLQFGTFFVCLAAVVALGWEPSWAKAPSCDLDSITDDCKIFDGEKPIRYPDGTEIPMLAKPEPPNSKIVSNSRRRSTQAQEELALASKRLSWEVRQSILSHLREVNGYTLNNQAKLYLSNNPELFDRLLDSSKSAEEVIVPWPMSGATSLVEEPKLERLPISRVKNFLQFNVSIMVRRRIKRELARLEKLTDQGGGSFPYGYASLENTVSTRRKGDVQVLVTKAKRKVEKILLAGRKVSDLSDEEKGLLIKIKDIKPVFTAKNARQCRSEVGTAYYQISDNTIQICPQLVNYPDQALMAVIGHELSHPMDPCRSQLSYWKINSLTASRLERMGPGKEITKSPARNQLFQLLVNMSTKMNIDRTTASFELSNSPEDIAYFEKIGLLDKISSGIPAKDYPLAEVYKCLTKSKGGSFREKDEKDLRKKAEEIVAYRSEVLGSSYNPKKDVEKIVEAFKRYPQCDGISNRSQINEAVSDWVGTEVAADFIKGKKLETPNERLSAVGFYAILACLERRKMELSQASVPEVVAAAKHDWELLNDSHAASARRLSKVYLNHPDIKKALGCKGGSHCRQKSKVGKSNKKWGSGWSLSPGER